METATDMRVLVIGAGLYGCTLARLLKDEGHIPQLVEMSDSIGGMCHTHYEHGIEVHDFGPHIFHTDDEWAWKFVNKFSPFNRYEHHVVAEHGNTHFFLPFNKMLIEQFFGVALKDPLDAKNFMAGMVRRNVEERNIDPGNPKNLEEQAISLIGADLYSAFVKNYTAKQWHKDPSELDASIIKRIPVRLDYNMSYFNDRFVGIPTLGYTKMLQNIVEGIPAMYNFKASLDDIKSAAKWFDAIVYTGPLDELFGYSLGQLEWRSLKFENKTFSTKSYQGTACINYVDADVPYTRIHEYKYYHPEDRS